MEPGLPSPTTTKFPVVFIHGVFGFGKTRPMWNRWCPYWPEKILDKLNANHVVLHVGPLTSNHDRACEAFYQLYGGRVDYGDQHSRRTGHERFGATYESPLHPNWSASNPVHLVGHSFGATTALELYQLVCQDFFGVGSDFRWVRSIVSIAGPLTGSTMAHLVGVSDGKMTRGSPIYLTYVACVLWFQLYKKFPVLKPACDVHLDQWSKLSLREMLAVNGPVNESQDLGAHDSVPSRRVARNAGLKHLDKLHLLTIVSSPKITAPPIRDSMALTALLLMIFYHGAFRKWRAFLLRFRVFRVVLGLYLVIKLRRVNVVTLPVLDVFKWISHRHARSLPSIFDGCSPLQWGPNDGCVNTHSMLEPWFPRPRPTKKTATGKFQGRILHTGLEKGRWYAWHVRGNHFAGTYWDNDAAELYKDLFTRIASEDEQDDATSLQRSTSHEHHLCRQNAKATWIFRRNQSQESLRGE